MSEAKAADARRAGEGAGVLVDVQTASLPTLPFAADAFDVVIVHAGDSTIPTVADPAGVPTLREAYRVLRSGGRLLIIEGGSRGIAGLLRGRRPLLDPAATIAALGTAGFRAARPLADREGYRFTEGLK
jgi:SAM-dependent methyltransferase